MKYKPSHNWLVFRVELKPGDEGVIDSADFHPGDTVFHVSLPYLSAHPELGYPAGVSGIDIANCSDADLKGLSKLGYPGKELAELRYWGRTLRDLELLRLPGYRIEPALISLQ